MRSRFSVPRAWSRLTAFVLGVAACAAAAALPAPARAGECRVLRYTFQPDCFRAAGGTSCLRSVEHLDLGPQIAVWLASADGKQFIDTLMVTNMTGARGIGNRPGIWNFLSGPKFPYGRREMVLPVWAHARGRLYPQVVMQEDDREDWLGWHESYSSEDLYFCRPLRGDEIDVDAISCPTKFNSEKGKNSSAQSYYPPRNDLTNFVGVDTSDARGYSAANDLDAVATATPSYGRPFTASWSIPSNLPAGDYALFVEVNKEFDTNASHDHPWFEDPRLTGYGVGHNFGQPSVVYKVPVHIEAAVMTPATAATSQIAGYSDFWAGNVGAMLPPDGTISTTEPGSGANRLLEITGPGGTGRVHVSVEACKMLVCDPPPPPPMQVGALAVVDATLGTTSAELRFTNAASGDPEVPVQSYEIRYRAGSSMSAAEFEQATSAGTVEPSAPGTPVSLLIQDLKPATSYVIGVRSIDSCGQRSEIGMVAFSTGVMKFKQLSGCFIATAAYGSALEPQVDTLRQARDRLRPASSLFAAATDLYYRSGPAAADVLRRSDTARAVVRRALAPLAAVTEAALAVARR